YRISNIAAAIADADRNLKPCHSHRKESERRDKKKDDGGKRQQPG
ncbi:hypothetical protein A2U01_0076311, partial [Trifolium medium]|nr:hypothetical protein [Trifolium medium]